jgi:hypothetical protein
MGNEWSWGWSWSRSLGKYMVCSIFILSICKYIPGIIYLFRKNNYIQIIRYITKNSHAQHESAG